MDPWRGLAESVGKKFEGKQRGSLGVASRNWNASRGGSLGISSEEAASRARAEGDFEGEAEFKEVS